MSKLKNYFQNKVMIQNSYGPPTQTLEQQNPNKKNARFRLKLRMPELGQPFSPEQEKQFQKNKAFKFNIKVPIRIPREWLRRKIALAGIQTTRSQNSSISQILPTKFNSRKELRKFFADDPDAQQKIDQMLVAYTEKLQNQINAKID